jgi:hypothetical protein
VLDTVVRLSRPDDYSPTEGARFIVDFEKARGVTGDPVAPFEARLEMIDSRAVWTMNAIEEALIRRAVELFRDGFSVSDVGKELKITKSRAGRLRLKAKEKGLISETVGAERDGDASAKKKAKQKGYPIAAEAVSPSHSKENETIETDSRESSRDARR